MPSFTGYPRKQDSGPSEASVVVDRLVSHKTLVEEYLAGLTFSDNSRFTDLIKAMRYSFLAGHTRIRPVLCMEVAGTFGLAPTKVLPSAAAVELVYTLSAVHEALPALATGGSGRKIPACHEKFGEATAILAGDGFLGESLALVTFHQEGTPEQIVSVVRELAGSAGINGMVGGQVLHMNCARYVPDAGALNAMQNYRTGTLMGASARIGAILAGASPEEREAVSEYAQELGLCSQVTEDLLKATPRMKEPGKDYRSAGQREAPFVEVYGLSGARRLAGEALERALETLRRIRGDTAGLEALARSVRNEAR